MIELYRLMYGGDIPPLRFHLLQPGETELILGIHVLPFRVPHQIQAISLGLKISYEGKQILFSGDSAWTDLFLSHVFETFIKTRPTIHLNRRHQKKVPRRQSALKHFSKSLFL